MVNTIGLYIVKDLIACRSMTDIVSRIQQEYAVDPGKAERDVSEFIDQLLGLRRLLMQSKQRKTDRQQAEKDNHQITDDHLLRHC